VDGELIVIPRSGPPEERSGMSANVENSTTRSWCVRTVRPRTAFRLSRMGCPAAESAHTPLRGW
jgi:hypothetical protein